MTDFVNFPIMIIMTCFVFEVKKMRAEISDPDLCLKVSETVWSSSYDLFCV